VTTLVKEKLQGLFVRDPMWMQRIWKNWNHIPLVSRPLVIQFFIQCLEEGMCDFPIFNQGDENGTIKMSVSLSRENILEPPFYALFTPLEIRLIGNGLW
jgi:hypothetical protein